VYENWSLISQTKLVVKDMEKLRFLQLLFLFQKK
jgi:hypothetical protein